MKTKIPPITEGCDELQRLIRKEHDALKKQRLTALYLLKTGQAKTRIKVARLLGVHRDTVGRWLTAYQKGGLSFLMTRGKAKGREALLSMQQMSDLKQRLQSPQGFPSYKAIVDVIQTEYGVEMSYKAVYTLLHDKWKAKLKVPRKSHKKKLSASYRIRLILF